MENKKQTEHRSFRIYLKSFFLTILAILLLIIGYFAAGFFFGVN